jgi:hypothetical protein
MTRDQILLAHIGHLQAQGFAVQAARLPNMQQPPKTEAGNQPDLVAEHPQSKVRIMGLSVTMEGLVAEGLRAQWEDCAKFCRSYGAKLQISVEAAYAGQAAEVIKSLLIADVTEVLTAQEPPPQAAPPQ